MQFTFHVAALPHTQTTAEYSACAYTAKVIKFCRMMKDLGHRVFLYASEENEAPCDELITVITKEEQRLIAGDYDHRQEMFRIDWDVRSAWWGLSNVNTILAMRERIGERDFIGIIGGNCQKPISDAFPAHQSVEWGVGYHGIYTPFRVFESYSHMHYVYGLTGQGDGNYYDTVIPNYFDPADFPLGAGDGDYFLYFGRMIRRKGVEVAAQVSQALGVKLVLAGQGVSEVQPGKIVLHEGDTLLGDHLEYVGVAEPQRRAELMGRAKGLFVPTTYIEPFGGVAAEAMLTGAPVFTSDWGAFTETVLPGKTGFRCRTLAEFMEAARRADELDRARIRRYAVNRFGLDTCGRQYDAYFHQVYDLWDGGWDNPAGPAQLSRYELPAW